MAGTTLTGNRLSLFLALATAGVLCAAPHAAADANAKPEPGTLEIIAGTGMPGYSGDNGPAREAQMRAPIGLAVDAQGNLYIAELMGHRVRKVSTDGIITTFAGTGKAGSSGDNGPAREAQLDGPNFIAFDGAGNLFIAVAGLTSGGGRVRKVSPDGIITLFAGGGKPGHVGDGGLATQADIDIPHGLVADKEGNLYISEEFGHRVRKVTPDGTISTIAGTGQPGSSGDGGPATEAKINVPSGLGLDAMGNLYFAEFGGALSLNYGSRVRKISPDGIITTVAGGPISGFSGDGAPVAEARLKWPFAVVSDTAGNLFITDYGNYRVRKIGPDGTISTVAGTGKAAASGDTGPATAASLRGPTAMAIDAVGNLYVANTSFRLNDGLLVKDWVAKVHAVATPGLIAGAAFPAPQQP